MPTDPLAGLVLAGFDGTTADCEGARALTDLGVGGFVLFARNVESPHQVHALLDGLRRACGGRPLLLGVDQEGGRVARLKAPLTEWPPMATVGASGDPAIARQVGHALASEVAAVGFNLLFAPVLDVRFSGTTDAIGDRSLGHEPAMVALLGRALANGIADAGIASTAKHFPGHGAVTVDSHLALPTCPLDAETLRRDHVAPFGEAIDAGVEAIMTAHVVYPALDAVAPATLSEPILQGLLRKELGFSGVVLSDDMEMGAIANDGDIAGACVRAIRAGVDGLLVCRDRDAVEATIAGLRREADRDIDFLARCLESLARLEDLAIRRPSRPVPADQLAAAIGQPKHLALAASLGEDTDSSSVDPTRAHLS